MTQYQRGSRFEAAIRADLESDGYWTIRAAGSHGLADVIATKPGEVLAVQAKLGVMPHGEWNALFRLCAEFGMVPLVADRPKRGAIRYRRITGVHVARSRTWPCELWAAEAA